MINIDITTKQVNKGMDFQRDEDLGYMLTDFDIINGICLADYNDATYEEAEKLFNKIRAERKRT